MQPSSIPTLSLQRPPFLSPLQFPRFTDAEIDMMSEAPDLSGYAYLEPPRLDMIDAALPIADQIRQAADITEAYFVHCIFTRFPSPTFPLPQKYLDLLAPLGPASQGHAEVIDRSLDYITTSEVHHWNRDPNPFQSVAHKLSPTTAHALHAMHANWAAESFLKRVFLACHQHLLFVGIDTYTMPQEDGEATPTPLPEGIYLDPSGNRFTLQADASPVPSPPGSPAFVPMMRTPTIAVGQDTWLYEGSYIQALERMLGYREGEGFHHANEVFGFLRGFGYDRVLPALRPALDALVAAYRAHPVRAFSDIFEALGAPRHGLSLIPFPTEGLATEEDTATIQSVTDVARVLLRENLYYTREQPYSAGYVAVRTLESSVMRHDVET